MAAKGRRYEEWFRQNGISSAEDQEAILSFMEELFAVATEIAMADSDKDDLEK